MQKKERQEIDGLMIHHIEKDIRKIKNSLSAVCPKRMKILNVAFGLHEEKVFVAAIPLFLAQAEGVFRDCFNASIFSKRRDEKEKINSVLDQNVGNHFNAFLSASTRDTLIRQNTNSFPNTEICMIPNRHGILHGNIEFINYGTHINSCKSISVLAYTAFMTEFQMDR